MALVRHPRRHIVEQAPANVCQGIRHEDDDDDEEEVDDDEQDDDAKHDDDDDDDDEGYFGMIARRMYLHPS